MEVGIDGTFCLDIRTRCRKGLADRTRILWLGRSGGPLFEGHERFVVHLCAPERYAFRLAIRQLENAGARKENLPRDLYGRVECEYRFLDSQGDRTIRKIGIVIKTSLVPEIPCLLNLTRQRQCQTSIKHIDGFPGSGSNGLTD